MNKKILILRFYKFINILPFNNKKKGKLRIVNDGSILRKCSITSRGVNNKLIYARGGYYDHCEFVFYGDNNTIEFGKNCVAKNGSFYIEDSSNSIIVGDGNRFCGKIHLAAIEGTTIKIGNDCLFSSEIVFRTGDSHSLVDLNGKRINPSKDVFIKNHVWVGHRVLVNKGVIISNNSVVGTGSVVTKEFLEDNVVIAGVPARIVKTNVNWNIERI